MTTVESSAPGGHDQPMGTDLECAPFGSNRCFGLSRGLSGTAEERDTRAEQSATAENRSERLVGTSHSVGSRTARQSNENKAEPGSTSAAMLGGHWLATYRDENEGGGPIAQGRGHWSCRQSTEIIHLYILWTLVFAKVKRRRFFPHFSDTRERPESQGRSIPPPTSH